MAAAMTVLFLISSPLSGGYIDGGAVMFHRHDRSVTTALIRLDAQGGLGLAESVPHTPNSLHPGQGEAGGGKFGPEPGHMDIDGARLHEPVLPPHEIEKFFPTEDPARRAGQGRQELEFLRSEVDPMAPDGHLETVPIDLQVSYLQVKLAADGFGALAATDYRADTRDQLTRRKRLGHVVVCAHLEAEDLVALVDSPGHHDDGNTARIRLLLQAAAHFPTVQLGHHDVEEDQLGLALPSPLEGVGAVAREQDFVAFLRQVIAEELRHVLLVLHHEDARAIPSRDGRNGGNGAPSRDHPGFHLPRGSYRHGDSVSERRYVMMTAR